MLKPDPCNKPVTSALIPEDTSEVDLATKPTTEGTLGFCGIQDLAVLSLHAVPLGDDQTSLAMLSQVEELATRCSKQKCV